MSGNRQNNDFVSDFYGNNEPESEQMESDINEKSSETESASDNLSSVETDIINALKEVYDPEIPVNIYDLGLIYRLDLLPDGIVELDMTLTTAGCPVAETFPGVVANAVRSVPEVNDVSVNVVWDPPWTQDCMSEPALLQLGLL